MKKILMLSLFALASCDSEEFDERATFQKGVVVAEFTQYGGRHSLAEQYTRIANSDGGTFDIQCDPKKYEIGEQVEYIRVVRTIRK